VGQARLLNPLDHALAPAVVAIVLAGAGMALDNPWLTVPAGAIFALLGCRIAYNHRGLGRASSAGFRWDRVGPASPIRTCSSSERLALSSSSAAWPSHSSGSGSDVKGHS
jgi:hypothetical protein